MLQYAGTDERINAGMPAYETALKANKVPYQVYVYDGTQHGFNNDTTPRYDAKPQSSRGRARSSSSTSTCANTRA